MGALTAELSAFAPLTVIEIEERFCEGLRARFPTIEIIEADVRTVDFSEIGQGLVVFGNLPYSFSTDITLHLVANAAFIKRAVLLLQREYAERLAASPGSRDYGAISVTCQLHADLRLGPVVTGDAFYPAAGVESQVIELRFLSQPRCALANPFTFARVVAAAFMKRRKKLANALKATGAFPTDRVQQALETAGIDPARRAETLSVEDFCRLSDALGE